MSDERQLTDYDVMNDNLGAALMAVGNLSLGGMTNANRIDMAIAYCDRILSTNPNGAELMFLTEVKRILTGESDGRPVAEASDG